MVVFICLLLLSSCKSKDSSKETVDQSQTINQTESGKENENGNVQEEEEEEVVDETTQVEVEETKPEEETIETAATIGDVIPSKYFMKRMDDHTGTIEHISYTTRDYYGDGAELTKSAYVYLPYEYDASKQYNVLYLMHGIGGNEKEWGMFDDTSRVKAIMDNLIYHGDIEPFIVVTPNGRSSADFANTNADYNSFYKFGEELRNDLIPFIERTYATYAQYDENGYDLAATRDHRAMAGLSMGGMQTINIGLCQSLDIISYFGAFSAAPTTNNAATIASSIEAFPEDTIHYFYNICGKQDGIAWASSTAATGVLTRLSDRFVEGENFMWQEVSGAHDFNVWYLGFYNFAQVVFKTQP